MLTSHALDFAHTELYCVRRKHNCFDFYNLFRIQYRGNSHGRRHNPPANLHN